jgi:hypothetical protein
MSNVGREAISYNTADSGEKRIDGTRTLCVERAGERNRVIENLLLHTVTMAIYAGFASMESSVSERTGGTS